MAVEAARDRRWKFPAIPFLIGRPPDPVPENIISELSEFYVPDIADVTGRMYTVHGIRSIFEPALSVVGTALTVKCPPGDNLAVKKALRLVKPGDVLVVDAQGFTEWCLGGFQMLQRAIKERGLKGLIIYGAYRDASEAKAGGFPIYATAVSTWSGPKIGPGEINVPVCCGGVIVHAGDVVCASGDGIVIIPRDFAQTVAERLTDVREKKQSQPAGLAGLVAQDEAMEAYVEEMERNGLLVRTER